MSYLGDYAEDSIVDFKFTTRTTAGVPATLSGSPTLAVYKANGTTETAVGITRTIDFDSRTGVNHVRIDTSADAFYATGEDYSVVITQGTVDGVNVAGEVVGQFSIENRYESGTPPTVVAIRQEIDTNSTQLAAIKSKTDNLPGSPAAVGSRMDLVDAPNATAVTAIQSGLARTGADGDTLESLSDQLDGLTLDTGSGAYTLTVTVDDGDNPLQNALVRLVEGATNLAGYTNASGVIAFSVDAATYAVAITKAGYQFTPTTKEVTGTGSQTYSMSATSISASPVGTVTGYAICIGTDGQPEAGITHTLQQIKPGAAGTTYDATVRTTTSAETTGLVQFVGMVPGARYWLTRGDSTNARDGVRFTVPADATSPWSMDGVLGSP